MGNVEKNNVDICYGNRQRSSEWSEISVKGIFLPSMVVTRQKNISWKKLLNISWSVHIFQEAFHDNN